MTDESPTLRRRKLGGRLRRLRLARGLTGAQVAAHLEIAQPNISRVEGGKQVIRPRQLRELLDLYEVPEGERQELLDLARDGSEKGWWTRYAAVITRNYAEYIGMEAAATEIQVWSPVTVPGHLQTEDYTRALIRGGGLVEEGEAETLVEVRMERQRQMAGTRPQISAVLDESILYRVVGGPKTMAEQLRRLAEAAADPQTEIQIMPFDRGEHAVAIGGFTILQYSDGEPAVWGDTVAGDSCMEDEKPHLCIVAFSHLRSSALDPDESLALIRRALERSAMMDLKWRKSSRSSQGPHCVEVADLPGAVAVRDSKRPEAGAHVVTTEQWRAFLGAVKEGGMDL